MNQLQAQWAGGGLILTAAMFVAWSRVPISEAPEKRIGLTAASGNYQPVIPGSSLVPRHLPSSASHKDPLALPSILAVKSGSITSPSQAGSFPTGDSSFRPAPTTGAFPSRRKSANPTGLSTSESTPAVDPTLPVELKGGGGEKAAFLQRALVSGPVAFPAALIQIDHPAVASPRAEQQLDEIAGSFTEALQQSGLDPAAPEYRQLWNREQALADARFRAMYGGHAWMAHHVQSHHEMSGNQNP